MKEDPPDYSAKILDSSEGLIILEEFKLLDINSLTESEIQGNIEEICSEVDTLESILMSEMREHDDFYPTLTIQTQQGPWDLIIYKTITVQVYPEESIPTQLTKIMSKNSELSDEGRKEEEEERKVKVKISKINNLPSFSIKIMLPVTYPSRTPPIFELQKNELFPHWEKVINDEFQNIYSEDNICVYECFHYLQNEFVSDYKEKMNIDTLRLTITSSQDYEAIQSKSRDTLQYQLGREVHCWMICFENWYGNSIFVIANCNHYFCKTCIEAYCTSLINDGKVNGIKCPDMKCGKNIADSDLRKIISGEDFEKFEKFRISKLVDSSEDKTWCPIPEWGAIAKIKGGNLFGECSDCWFRFCLICKHFYHSGRRCPVLSLGINQFSKMTLKQQEEFIREKLNDYYVNKYCKPCPQCKTPISKTSGCNKMTCQNCHVYFCWKCSEIIKGYQHFEVNPGCWDTTGDRDVGYLTANEFDEVKENIGNVDMESSIVCPHCSKITKKKKEDNYLQCTHWEKNLWFYCGKEAKEDHYLRYSCHRFTKSGVKVDVDAVFKNELHH